MKQSQLFTKTRKDAPSDETSKNAQLLIRAGYIAKEMAGVYSFLPLGLRTLNKIMGVIREEMNGIGGTEVLMSSLQDPEIWKATGRWDDKNVEVWFKGEIAGGGEAGFGWTHEEAITRIASRNVSSYRDLPFAAYQFQNKFRNELRAKSGIMRTREFIMKDMYSFSRDEKEHQEFYDSCAEAYHRIFRRVGIGEKTYKTFASGGAFSKYSHEFQTLSAAGEDTVYVAEDKKIAINKEVLTEEVLKDLEVSRHELKEEKAIEVGNIFSLGTRFSDALNLRYKDDKGGEKSAVMGCYGIGPARVMGTIAEVLSDANGLIWPKEVAPFSVHIISIGEEGSEASKKSLELHDELASRGVEVLLDDRELRAGEKFADADLIGVPLRVVISDKSLKGGGFEVKERTKTESQIIKDIHGILSLL